MILFGESLSPCPFLTKSFKMYKWSGRVREDVRGVAGVALAAPFFTHVYQT